MNISMKKIRNMTEKQRNIAIVIVLLVFAGLGFGDEIFKVETCTARVSKYVTAEFSETTTSTDSEGNPTIDTDYWSEAVSPVNTISKLNAMPEYPEMPDYDRSAKNDYDFDRFEFHTDATLTTYATNGEESTVFTDGIHKTAACLNTIGAVVVVKTWWFITYGSDF